jgi:VanZ family protein
MMHADKRVKSGESGGRVAPSWREVALAWGPALLWAAAIFYVSAENTWTVFEGPPLVRAIRKLGHVFEYAVLALLVGRGLLALFTDWGRKPATRRVLLRVWQVGVAVTTLYAMTDELHQLFVPRRVGFVWDVLVDALSATAALGIWYIVRVRRRTKGEERRTKNEERRKA